MNYAITSNHTHLLLKVRRPARVSVFMRQLEGEFAAHYNRRKQRRGAFWSERYHATVIEDGCHLWNCMYYIDLNMVRAGVVDHPAQWRWCGYQEISIRRERYRILDLRELVGTAAMSDLRAFNAWYETGLNETLRTASGQREPHWTESIAVGSHEFVERFTVLSKSRRNFEFGESADGVWYVRESRETYRRRRITARKKRKGALDSK